MSVCKINNERITELMQKYEESRHCAKILAPSNAANIFQPRGLRVKKRKGALMDHVRENKRRKLNEG